MKRTYGQVIASIEDGVTAGDEPLIPTLNIPPSRIFNHAGPHLITRNVIPREPLPQLIPHPATKAKIVRRTPRISFRPVVGVVQDFIGAVFDKVRKFAP